MKLQLLMLVLIPKGGERIFPLKSALVDLNCGGRNVEQERKYAIHQAFWNQAKRPPAVGVPLWALTMESRQVSLKSVGPTVREAALDPQR